MALREVLYLVYHFPPLGMGGVQRPLKFVKYLPQFGWRPVVLTVKPIRYYVADGSLLSDIPEEARIIRCGSLDPLRVWKLLRRKTNGAFGRTRSRFKICANWLAIPDLSLGWLPFAVSTGLSVIRSRPIKAILATAPPYSALLVGGIIARISGLPLVLDFRDAWTQCPPRSFPTGLHLSINRWLENRCLKSAARVLSVNEALAHGLRSVLPPSEQAKVHVLLQGYDPEDFSDVQATLPTKFRISHVGTLIDERSPKPLLEGLKWLFVSHPWMRKDIEVRFVGHHRPEDEQMIREAGLEDVVTCISYRPHRESVSELLSAHVLYLVIGAGEGAITSPGKPYEYLGARKPILASAPDCEAVRILEAIGAGRAFNPRDGKGLAQEIYRLYVLHSEGKLIGPSFDAVRRYDRRELAGELARHLSEVA